MEWGWRQTELTIWVCKTTFSLLSLLVLGVGPGLRVHGLICRAKGARELGLHELATTPKGPWAYSGRISLDLWGQDSLLGFHWNLYWLWLFWVAGLLDLASSAAMAFWDRWKLARSVLGAALATTCACGTLLYSGCGQLGEAWRPNCSVWGFQLVAGLSFVSLVGWLFALGAEICWLYVGEVDSQPMTTAGTLTEISGTTQEETETGTGGRKASSESNYGSTCNDAIFLGEAPTVNQDNSDTPPPMLDPWESPSHISRRIRTRSKLLPTRKRSKQIDLDIKSIGSSQETQWRRMDTDDATESKAELAADPTQSTSAVDASSTMSKVSSAAPAYSSRSGMEVQASANLSLHPPGSSMQPSLHKRAPY